MTRHHTVGYPRVWVEPLIVDGEEVDPGHYNPAYQLDIPFTAVEEAARDAEEAAEDARALAAEAETKPGK